jgi:selenide,water dikinase
MVDDPYLFGQIAAVNALNDIYAMGGYPLVAMNVVCFPQCGDMDILGQILAGGLSKVKEAGSLIVGGHTVDDNEPKYGLAVCGTVHPQKVICNSTAQAGDLICLTKPLGGGIISTAVKAAMASIQEIEEASKWMSRLNSVEAQIMQQIGVNAATDITGFGLIGHTCEMAEASGVHIKLEISKLPFMKGVREYARIGLIPAGAYTNRDYFESKVEYHSEIDPIVRELLFSPETAGGLLISVKATKVEAMVQAMLDKGCTCLVVGHVLEKEKQPISIIA